MARRHDLADDGVKVISNLTQHQSRQVLGSFKTGRTTRWKANNANLAGHPVGRVLDGLLWSQAEVRAVGTESCGFLCLVQAGGLDVNA